MNIRRKVIFSFIILIVFIISIGFLSLVTTYQIREDSNFSKKVSTLIKIQEDMNEVINFTTSEVNINNLKNIKEKFQDFENSFEILKKEISTKNRTDYVDNLLNDVHQNQDVENSLQNLFKNEHSIEVIFDEIFDFQQKKLEHTALFDTIYPQENSKRKDLEKLIFKINNLELIQEFGNLKYYSKETLYQHKDEKTFYKWLESIDKIIEQLKQRDENSLVVLLQEYKETVNSVGNLVIEIYNVEIQEHQLIKRLKEILKNNKIESTSIEEKISKITESFLNKISATQLFLVIVIIILTLLLTSYISSKLTNIISKLSFGVKKLKDGEYDVNISIDEDNEFQEIAATFNKMAKNIEEHKNTLEDKIEQRTKELQGALTNIQKQKDLLENLSNKLAKYLSPQVFESIFSGKQDVVLESKRKYLTVFFSDIKGFTDLTDSVETETLTQLLNEYLDIMSSIAIKHGGTIDKYIGDCIMIFFGDPISNGKSEDAKNCINMAIEMKEEMSKLRIKWQNEGISKSFHIRMGINSGYCTVGNFGSKNRLDYTIIGGVVNLASRLESNALPDQILISSETYMHIKNSIKCIKKDAIKAKGIAHEVQTYEVVATDNYSTLIDEENGFNLIIDLNEIEKRKVIEILEKRLKFIQEN